MHSHGTAVADLREKTQAQGITPKSRTTTGSHATEQTEVAVCGSQDVTIFFTSYRNEDSSEICFDAATEHIRIGPCILHWSQAAKLELGVLKALHIEIENLNRLPVSRESLLHSCLDDKGSPMKRRSWSGLVEAIARCVAAFQRATDATEHSQCTEIADKLGAHATDLAHRTSPYLREHLCTLLYEYIQNRTYDLAVKTMQKALNENEAKESMKRQLSECLDLLEIFAKALSDHAKALRDEMATLRLSGGSTTEQTTNL